MFQRQLSELASEAESASSGLGGSPEFGNQTHLSGAFYCARFGVDPLHTTNIDDRVISIVFTAEKVQQSNSP